jgi:hypothetical protein
MKRELNEIPRNSAQSAAVAQPARLKPPCSGPAKTARVLACCDEAARLGLARKFVSRAGRSMVCGLAWMLDRPMGSRRQGAASAAPSALWCAGACARRRLSGDHRRSTSSRRDSPRCGATSGNGGCGSGALEGHGNEEGRPHLRASAFRRRHRRRGGHLLRCRPGEAGG